MIFGATDGRTRAIAGKRDPYVYVDLPHAVTDPLVSLVTKNGRTVKGVEAESVEMWVGGHDIG